MDSMISIHSAVLVEGELERKHKHEVVSDIDGPYAWVIVVCSFFVFSIAAFNAMNFGVFATELVFAFGLSESEIGLIGALRLGISTFAGILSGPLVQRFGCRRVAFVSISVCALGHVMAAFATGAFSITITFGFIAGCGSGLTALPCIVLVQRYFIKKRALAASIASLGLGVSGIIASPLTRLLVDTYSWRGAMLMFAGLNLQMLVPAAFFRQPRGRLATLTFVMYCVMSVIKMLIIDTYYIRTAAIGLSIGLSPWEAALLPSVVGICSTTSRLISGFLGQVMSPYVLFAVGNLFSALPIAVLPLLPHTFVAYATSGVAFGFSMGLVLGIQHTAMVSLAGLDVLPLALSWVCVCTGVSRSVLNPFLGWLLDTTGSYDLPLYLASFTQLIIGGACGLTIIIKRKREEKHKPRKLMENGAMG